MMRSEPHGMPADGDVSDACWNRIGVQGDRSCPRLAEAVHCRNCPVFSSAGQLLFEREAPPEYLDEWTRQLAEVDRGTAGETLALLVFRVGPEWLALEAQAVIEVVSPRRIHSVPHRTDRLLLGLANVRGELQLCISLRELLGIELPPADAATESACSDGSKQRFIVAELDQNRWVFPVDEVEGVHRIRADAMNNLPHTVEKSPRHYSQAIICLENKNVGVLSGTRLSQALERTVR
jgi:chemotaxis-related protein WspD